MAVDTRSKLIRNSRKTTSVVRPNDNGSGSPIYMRFATTADNSPGWGTASRDIWLRKFWKTEDMLASAVSITAGRYAGLKWDLQGGPRTVEIVRQKLHLSEHGKGWKHLIIPTVIDACTQENGAWIEIYREGPRWDDPWVQLNHLDSQRCIRTGKWEQPIEYIDDKGKAHRMNWWQVMEVVDAPDPSEESRGMQICAVSRVLRAAQIIRDIAIYHHEKVSGQFNRQINIVNGVGKKVIEDALADQRMDASNQGLLRYIQPVILPTLDHRANLNKITIDLAALPEGWDFDGFMRWYIIQLALAFQQDPQEFAPLPGNNLGSGQQSETLHMKERNKGPNLFMATLEHQFNFQGIIPSNCTFSFGEQDTLVDIDKQRVNLMRSQELAILVKAGILTPQVAAQIYADEGRMNPNYLALLGIQDATSTITTGAVGSIVDMTKKINTSNVQVNRIGGGLGNTSDAPNETARVSST